MELDSIIRILSDAEIEILGQIAWGSNYTFLVKLAELHIDEAIDEASPSDAEAHAVYKPIKGERPLWDFPPDLAKRERAAFLLSEQLGWNLIPPTIVRDGPFGLGSLQFFIDSIPGKHYLNLSKEELDSHRNELEKLCALDIAMNSTDRKSGHVLIDKSQKIWAIDNALCFHTVFKLRTVIWDFQGQAISPLILLDLKKVLAELKSKTAHSAEIHELLSPEEISATIERISSLIEYGCFPLDPGGHSRPWPL